MAIDTTTRPQSSNQGSAASATDDFWLACLAQHHAAQVESGADEMIVERRTAPPHDVPYEATLIEQGVRYGAWKIRDMSTGGAFLEMDVTQLHEGAVVEFSLRYNFRGRLVHHRFPAKIIRIQLNGLALRFGYFDDQVRSDLVSLLYVR